MDNLTDDTKQVLFRLLDGGLSVKDFEQWVYDNSDKIKNELQPGLHFDLISLDYNRKDAFYVLRDKIKPYLDASEFNMWRTKQLLKDIVNNKIDIVLATRKLQDLYNDTNEKLIPITLGVGYDSELDDVPVPSEYHLWEDTALQEKLKKVELYKDNIRRDAKQVLDKLDEEK